MGTRRGPPLVRGPQFENRCAAVIGEGTLDARYGAYVSHNLGILTNW